MGDFIELSLIKLDAEQQVIEKTIAIRAADIFTLEPEKLVVGQRTIAVTFIQASHEGCMLGFNVRETRDVILSKLEAASGPSFTRVAVLRAIPMPEETPPKGDKH